MRKLLIIGSLLASLTLGECLTLAADAPAQAAPVLKNPTLEQRISDLEAYINNTGRASDTANNYVKSNVAAPGPGHNGWMMTSSALVLFMTLPGLALFYGGWSAGKMCCRCWPNVSALPGW